MERNPDGAAQRPVQAAVQRVFIVGCPRSGTTFLQHSLARHPQVLSLPETHLFERTIGGFDRWLGGDPVAPPPPKLFGFAKSRVHRQARRALDAIAAAMDAPRPLWRWRWSLEGYVRQFTGMMDGAAHRHGCKVWIEKTPNHVAYVEAISALVPGARFVHLLRRGEDVIASLVDAALHHDDRLRPFDRALPWWVSNWNRAAETHLRYAADPQHLVLCYDDLIDDFASLQQRVLDFMALTPATARSAPVDVARLDSEPWKRTAVSGALIPARRKFEQLFGPELRAWILGQLQPYEPLRRSIRIAQGQSGQTPGTATVRSLSAARR